MTEIKKKGSSDTKFQIVHTYVMNPKSISIGELYGEVNPNTMEW